MASSSTSSSRVRVGVRIRPLTSQEIAQGGTSVLSTQCSEVRLGQRRFTYDAVFDCTVHQEELYLSVSKPLLETFVDGYNATIMAYGQTGSGKTFTMGSEAHADLELTESMGLIPRFMNDLFASLEAKRGDNQIINFSLSASFLEVYGEDVHDLLNKDRPSLPLREDASGGVVCAGLTYRPVKTATQALQVLHEGTLNRTTAATLMNLTSSRSHAVFTVDLTQMQRDESSNIDVTTKSRFTFVDLAGSERMKKTGAEGERAREGIKINEGLLALGNVINALADDERLTEGKKVHVPYRQSKLTRLLQDALGGNSKTLFLACVSPSDTNASETLSTLHYANRARNIKNAPTKNVDGATIELQKLQAYNDVLQFELVKLKFGEFSKENRNPVSGVPLADNDEELLQREDVIIYLNSLREKAQIKPGETQSIDLRIGYSGQTILPITATSPPSPELDALAPFSEDNPHNKSVLESFDPGMLDEVNPDEEMAIVDQLLELQQRENDFDNAQKKDDAQLKEVEGELAKQESMLLQLRESLKVYHTMKAKYEELMAEVQQLEVEKAQLAEQLEKASADPTQGCSKSIKKELEKVENSLARARNETRKHRQMYKKAEQEAQKCRALERKINELKSGRAALIRKQKEAAAKHREYTETKTREILALKKRERTRERELSKLQSEILMHKKNLEKRQIYCTKLSQKLKQTEDHLMKLLSIRQRDFKRRQSVVVVPKRSNAHVAPTSEQESPLGPSSEETKLLLYVIDETVDERVRLSVLNQHYEDRVKEYSSTMKSLVEAVRALEEAEKIEEDDTSTHSNLSELVQNVEEVELKVELLSAELGTLRSQLQLDGQTSVDSNDAITKLIVDKSPPVLRTVILSIVDQLVEVKLQKKHLESALERKESLTQSLEIEVETLNERIDVLSREISARRAVDGDSFPTIMALQTEKDALCEKVQTLESEITQVKAEHGGLVSTVRTLEQSLCSAREQLTAAEVALSHVNGAVAPDEVMMQLQGVWAEIGVSPEFREQARSDIARCLDDTCQRKLNEALDTKERTIQQIKSLESEIRVMQQALGEMPLELRETETTLLQALDAVSAIHSTLKPAYLSAFSRRSLLANDSVNIMQSLGYSQADLGESLQNLVREHPQQTKISDELPIASPESLTADFLGKCESDLSKLRIDKSKILARNAEVRKSASILISEMNLSEAEIAAMVSKSIPSWWNTDAFEAVVRSIVSESGLIRSTKSFSMHMEHVHECLDRTARARRLMSAKLKQIVERAQKTLIDAVNGEVDAKEAYSSFHDALFRLPPLSKDFIDACSSEIAALSSGVDVMTQSEIEALAVVWEALNESMSTRGKFWGTIDDEILSIKANPSGPFDDVVQQSQQWGEEWLLGVVKDITSQYRQLETRLHKLEKVHAEVERLRSRQDVKSRIISLDSEVRILNAQLSEFEEKKCGKNRLLTKKSGSSGLLKEERFRKQMQAKFTAKLDQLAKLLTSWESDEGSPFDAELLSDEVRMLLSASGDRHNWVEKRTEFMHLRTVKSKITSKRRIENSESESPPKKRQARSQRDVKQSQSLENNENVRPPRLESITRKRKTEGIPQSRQETKIRSQSPAETGRVTRSKSVSAKETTSTLVPLESTTTKKRLTLPPFGHVLAQAQSPREHGYEQEF